MGGKVGIRERSDIRMRFRGNRDELIYAGIKGRSGRSGIE